MRHTEAGQAEDSPSFEGNVNAGANESSARNNKEAPKANGGGPHAWGYNLHDDHMPTVSPFSIPDMRHKPTTHTDGPTTYELLGTGMYEALPPADMIEDL